MNGNLAGYYRSRI